MIRYLDTSVLVASLTLESKTTEVQRWLAGQVAGSLMISDWVITEFSAALSVKLRQGLLDARERAAAVKAFAEVTAASFVVSSVSPLHFRAGARLADQYSSGLRAGDALHLAIAIDAGAALCTLDRRLASAADALGAKPELL